METLTDSSGLLVADGFKYWAFISYNRVDEGLAKALHKKLETYRIPSGLAGKPMPKAGLPRPQRLFPIFRDRDDLSAGANLTESVKENLRLSRHLIVVCSPHAARSKWVNREIEYFRSLNRAEQILPVIVEGDPNSNGDDACFPPQLRGTGVEPLAADMRKIGDGKVNAPLKLLANLFEVEFDVLKQRDTKRRIIRLQCILSASLMLILIFAGLTWYSNDQRIKAVRARQQAESLVEFLLFELQDKLEPIGRLDLLREVQSRIDEYYAASGRDINQPHMLRNRAAAYQNDGQRLLAEGKLDKALGAFLACRSINQRLAEQDPKNPIRQRDLAVSILQVGDVLIRQGHSEEAMKAYKSSLERQLDLSQGKPATLAQKRDLAVCYGRLGDAFSCLGTITNALCEYQRALAIEEEIVLSHNGGESSQQDLALSREKVGDILLAQGEQDKAEACFRTCLHVRESLALMYPANALYQRELAIVHDKLGDLFYDAGKLTDSMQHYQNSFTIRKRLTVLDPENKVWQRDLSVSHEKIGDLFLEQGKAEKAIAEYSTCLDERKVLAANDVTNANTKRDLWVAFWKMGEATEKGSDYAIAQKYRKEALTILQTMKQANQHLSPQDLEVLDMLNNPTNQDLTKTPQGSF